jgi:hypothetical protein
MWHLLGTAAAWMGTICLLWQSARGQCIGKQGIGSHGDVTAHRYPGFDWDTLLASVGSGVEAALQRLSQVRLSLYPTIAQYDSKHVCTAMHALPLGEPKSNGQQNKMVQAAYFDPSVARLFPSDMQRTCSANVSSVEDVCFQAVSQSAKLSTECLAALCQPTCGDATGDARVAALSMEYVLKYTQLSTLA